MTALGLTGVHAMPRMPGSVIDNHKGVLGAGQSTLEELQVLEGHTDRVWCVAWSPSGAPPLRPCTALWKLRCPSTPLHACYVLCHRTHLRSGVFRLA